MTLYALIKTVIAMEKQLKEIQAGQGIKDRRDIKDSQLDFTTVCIVDVFHA